MTENLTSNMKWLCVFLISVSAVSATICPGGGHCAGTETCCLMSSGHYGCCPYPNAMCCPDREHCCPYGYSCMSDRCVRKANATFSETVLMRNDKIDSILSGSSKDLLIKTSPAKPVNTVCPDPRYSCTGADPCCRTPGGAWTCCIYPHGTCCTDGYHCCPYGMICIQSSYCIKGNVTIPTKPSPLSKANSQSEIICPDKSKCDNGNTCCKLPGGIYGCCPLPNAVCCSDEMHCCPHSLTCNEQSQSCSDGITEIPWFTKTRAFYS